MNSTNDRLFISPATRAKINARWPHLAAAHQLHDHVTARAALYGDTSYLTPMEVWQLAQVASASNRAKPIPAEVSRDFSKYAAGF